MSGLAPVLAGREPTGLFRWAAEFTAQDLTATLEVTGWRLAALDGAYAQTKAEVLAALGVALELPDYYGANFDALADCLSDLETSTVLLWDDWGPFARADERSFSILRRILESRARDTNPSNPSNPSRPSRPIKPGFLVLLRGEGPDLDIPLLD